MNTLDARRRLLGRNVYRRTTEGNPAIAQGSLARRYPGIAMQGWTEQAQYEGNQLLPLPVGKVIESESGKNTLTVTENGVNLNITEPTTSAYTNDIYIFGNSKYNIESGYEDASVYIPQGLYTLLNDTITNLEVFLSVWRNGVKIDLILSAATRPANFTIMNGDKIRLGIRPKGTLEINNMMLMVIKQTLPSTTPFEPYTGGQPSPSPDYPQEITSAGNYNEETQKYEYGVKLTGANLFDYSPFVNENGYMSSSYATPKQVSPFHVEEGKKYVLITKGTIEVNNYSSIYFGEDDLSYFDKNSKVLKTGLNYNAFDGGVQRRYVMTATKTCDITKCMVHGSIYIENACIVEEFGLFNYIDGVSENYEPYRLPQTVTLTSDRPLTKWDKLEKRNGQWGWVYKSAEVVLDGSENYAIYDRGAPGYPSILFSHNMTGEKMGQNNLYCEQLKYSNNIFNEKNLEYCYMGYNVNNGVYIGISTGENVTNVSEFKAWLSENPITFLYETDKETFVPLSEAEQEQMNELYTFRPTTVLSNDCECDMILTYKTKKSLEVTI